MQWLRRKFRKAPASHSDPKPNYFQGSTLDAADLQVEQSTARLSSKPKLTLITGNIGKAVIVAAIIIIAVVFIPQSPFAIYADGDVDTADRPTIDRTPLPTLEDGAILLGGTEIPGRTAPGTPTILPPGTPTVVGTQQGQVLPPGTPAGTKTPFSTPGVGTPTLPPPTATRTNPPGTTSTPGPTNTLAPPATATPCVASLSSSAAVLAIVPGGTVQFSVLNAAACPTTFSIASQAVPAWLTLSGGGTVAALGSFPINVTVNALLPAPAGQYTAKILVVWGVNSFFVTVFSDRLPSINAAPVIVSIDGVCFSDGTSKSTWDAKVDDDGTVVSVTVTYLDEQDTPHTVSLAKTNGNNWHANSGNAYGSSQLKVTAVDNLGAGTTKTFARHPSCEPS